MGSLLSKQGKLGKRDAGKTSKKRSSFMAPVRLENVSGLLKLGRAMRKKEGAAMRGEDGDVGTAAAAAAATDATDATDATPATVPEPMAQGADDDGNGLAQDMATMSMTGAQGMFNGDNRIENPN
jgi:hypothetical protein